MYLIIILLGLTTQFAWSQSHEILGPHEADFIESHETIATSLGIPVEINQDGEISFLEGAEGGFILGPTIAGGFSKKNLTYIAPIKSDKALFQSIQTESVIQYKSLRYEYGLGLDALIKAQMGVGISPYKGAKMAIVQYKKSRNTPNHSIKLPQRLEDFATWEVGDMGVYQTFGGVELSLSGGMFYVGLGASVQIQNQFLVSIRKIAPDSITVSIAEEKLNHRKLEVSIPLAEASMSWLKGRKLSGIAELSLSADLHRDLYKELLKGNLKSVQEKLPLERHSLNWEGTEKTFSWGIPAIWKKDTVKSEYSLVQNGEEAELLVFTRKDKGFLRSFISSPVKTISHYVYLTSTQMVLFWNVDITKTSKQLLERHLLSPMRAMGSNVEKMAPAYRVQGKSLGQLGVSFSKNEFTSKVLGSAYEEHLVQSCIELKLECRNSKSRKAILSKLEKLMAGSKELSELGKHLMDYPVLIGAYLKSQGLKKSVHFKFLGESFQSMEGEALLE